MLSLRLITIHLLKARFMKIFLRKYFFPLLFTLSYTTITPSAQSTAQLALHQKRRLTPQSQDKSTDDGTQPRLKKLKDSVKEEPSDLNHETKPIIDFALIAASLGYSKSATSTTIQLPKTKFNCGICDKNFARSDTLRRHEREQHEQSATQLTCSMCNATFSRRESLKSHQRTHTSSFRKKFPCGNCEKSYLNKGDLTRHQRDSCFPTDHNTSPTINLNPDTPFSCSQCNRSYKMQAKLLTHLAVPHTFQCASSNCNIQFVRARELAQHRSIHKRKRTHSNKPPHPQGKSTDDDTQRPRLKRSKRPQKDLVTIVRGTRLMHDHEERFLEEPTLDDEMLTGAYIPFKANTYK